MKKQLTTVSGQHPHDFHPDVKKTKIKGKEWRTANGLIMFPDKSEYVYACKRCDSELIMDEPAKLDDLNMQLAQRFSCR